jgi:hypothetical protein
MALIPGSIDANGEFVESSSLAKAIDDALPKKAQFGQTERRQLIIAIATGIIDYLKSNTNAFTIAVSVNASTHTGSGTLMIT